MGQAVRPTWRGRVIGGAELPRPAALAFRLRRLVGAAATAAGGEGRSAAS